MKLFTDFNLDPIQTSLFYLLVGALGQELIICIDIGPKA